MKENRGRNGRGGKRKLTDRQREIVTLRKAELTFREIAQVLGTSQPYVIQTYNKVMKQKAA